MTFVNTYTSCHTDDDRYLEDIFDTTLINQKITTHRLNENNNSSTKIILNEKLKLSVRESIWSNRKNEDNINIDVLGEEFCYYLIKLYQDFNINNIENRVNGIIFVLVDF